jgi:hypothetical protein
MKVGANGMRWVLLIFAVSLFAPGQAPPQQPSTAAQSPTSAQPAPPAAASSPAQQPATTMRSLSRMVTIEVVARDHHGGSVTGLSAADFQVSEQIAGNKERHPQKIAAFAVSISEIAAQDQGKLQVPARRLHELCDDAKRAGATNNSAGRWSQHGTRLPDAGASADDPHAGFYP